MGSEMCIRDRNRVHYFSMQLDHLLPRSKYPHLANDPDNFVLSCQRCNNLKRAYDPLDGEKNPEGILRTDKPLVVEKVRVHLKERIEKDNILLNELNILVKF